MHYRSISSLAFNMSDTLLLFMSYVMLDSNHNSKYLKFDSDGKKLAGLEGMVVKVWDTESGQLLLNIAIGDQNSRDKAKFVCFNGDGSKILLPLKGVVK
jgi:hypothetical protein